MPLKDKAEYNRYMSQYLADRYERRRAEAVIKLGGSCSNCSSRENLEFDHVDPTKKSFYVGKAFASMAQDRLDKEIEKCQLLCKSCHDVKTYGRVA